MRISDWSSDVCSSDLQRVWQPWADIGFATRACGFQAVEAQARDDARQIGGRRIDPAIDLFPSKPRILPHLLSLAERAEHSQDQAHEQLTPALEIAPARSLPDRRTARVGRASVREKV